MKKLEKINNEALKFANSYIDVNDMLRRAFMNLGFRFDIKNKLYPIFDIVGPEVLGEYCALSRDQEETDIAQDYIIRTNQHCVDVFYDSWDESKKKSDNNYRSINEFS